MWKYYGRDGQATDGNIIQRMCTVRWITKETETQRNMCNFLFCIVKIFKPTHLINAFFFLACSVSKTHLQYIFTSSSIPLINFTKCGYTNSLHNFYRRIGHIFKTNLLPQFQILNHNLTNAFLTQNFSYNSQP